MHDEKLVRMGNQIANFFDSMPNREEAMLDLATHLRKFWEPRMRRDFLAMLDAGDTQAMHPFLLAALQQHRALVT
ncbi:MAG: formate dehydrogenase subunit delta [Rhodoferax sp.]